MISKKSRKVVAALLIGATVCASGTFAYFNNKKGLSDIMNDANSREISITNGHVEITGAIDGTVNLGGAYWSYDIARESSGLTDPKKDSSPDILVNGSAAERSESEDMKIATTSGDLYRTKIGAALKGKISMTRPGDAIVLGDASSATNSGLIITNNSNITTKVKVRFKRDSSTSDTTSNAEAEFAKLANAGWKFYLNGTLYEDANTLKTALEDDIIVAPKAETVPTKPNPSDGKYKDETNPDNDGEKNTQYKADLAAYNAAVASNTVKSYKIRLELPKSTGNDYQDDSVGTDDGSVTFDLDDLFEVVATQENNPKWNEAGDSDTF